MKFNRITWCTLLSGLTKGLSVLSSLPLKNKPHDLPGTLMLDTPYNCPTVRRLALVKLHMGQMNHDTRAAIADNRLFEAG
jgi:hypothetical protein